MQRARGVTAVADADLVRAIEEWNVRVVSLRRRPFEYKSSAALELITAAVANGAERRFVLKHVGDISERARRVKPGFVLDPYREVEVYRRLLAPLGIGPRLIGSAVGLDSGDWLLIEEIDGQPLYEARELHPWAAVARSLGAMHARFMTLDHASLQQSARLLNYDRQWYAIWLERASRFFSVEGPINSRRTTTSLRWLAERYDKVVERMLSLPNTIIHGELYASNVLVSGGPVNPTVCAIDWEMTAIGPGIVDLAALTSGHWTDADRDTLIAAYAAGCGAAAGATLAETVELTTYAQIHLAVQWLGWFGRRGAAAAHVRDWLSDAVDRAEALRL
jgi:hypothetical protein